MLDIFVANGIELCIEKCCDGVLWAWGGFCFIVGCYMKGVVAYYEVGEWEKARLYGA